jgi:hypothetical protein
VEDSFWTSLQTVTDFRFLLYRPIPVGLLAAGYCLFLKEYGSWNLALTSAASVSVLVCVVLGAFSPERSPVVSIICGVLLASVVALGIGKLLDVACFSAWSRMPAYWCVALSFGFASLVSQGLSPLHDLLLGKNYIFTIPEAAGLSERFGEHAIPVLIALCFATLLSAGFVLNKLSPRTLARLLPLRPRLSAAMLCATCGVAMEFTGDGSSSALASGIFSTSAFLAFCSAVIANWRGPLMAFAIGVVVQTCAIQAMYPVYQLSEVLPKALFSLVYSAIIPSIALAAVVLTIIFSQAGLLCRERTR